MTETAMIYTRGNNAELQIAKCEKYASENGIEVIGIISYETSELYQELGNVDALIIANPARLTRHYEEYISIKKALAEDGIKIIIAE